MSVECKPYQPLLPPEVVSFMGMGVRQWEWFPYPSREYWEPRRSGIPSTAAAIVESMTAAARQSGLVGTLDAVDIAIGCKSPCQTCIRDSQPLSSVMVSETFWTIANHPAFNELLRDDSVCVGFAAEPSDNPHVIEILRTLIDATSGKPNIRINVKVNYRRQKEERLREILREAATTDRFQLTISLPLNRDNRVQDDFQRFRAQNRDLFSQGRVQIFDLKNPKWQAIEHLGRVLPDAKDDPMSEMEQFQVRGRGGLILNPEGLWFGVNVTKYEAHTPEIFTPVTARNVHHIGQYLRIMNRQEPVDCNVADMRMRMAEKSQQPFPLRIG